MRLGGRGGLISFGGLGDMIGLSLRDFSVSCVASFSALDVFSCSASSVLFWRGSSFTLSGGWECFTPEAAEKSSGTLLARPLMLTSQVWYCPQVTLCVPTLPSIVYSASCRRAITVGMTADVTGVE